MPPNDEIDIVQEAGYNVRRLRPEFLDIIEGWTRKSERFRQNSLYRTHEYGPDDRDQLDLFSCGRRDAPLLIFLHGGYWQSGNKSIYSFFAESFNDAGLDVAIVGYPLCPNVHLSIIIEKVKTALAWLWLNGKHLGISTDRFNVCGHSAGGHLTAISMVTDWPRINQGLPEALIKTALPISGVFQLDPLRRTTIGDALNLTADEARRCSPFFQPPKGNPRTLLIVGERETELFHWQSDALKERWAGDLSRLEKFVAPSVDHFDIIDSVADNRSSLFQQIVEWVE